MRTQRRHSFAHFGWNIRLREARIDANLTQGEIGRKVGVHQSTVALWEAGENEPSLLAFEAVAKVTGVNPAWITFQHPKHDGVIRESASRRDLETAL